MVFVGDRLLFCRYSQCGFECRIATAHWIESELSDKKHLAIRFSVVATQALSPKWEISCSCCDSNCGPVGIRSVTGEKSQRAKEVILCQSTPFIIDVIFENDEIVTFSTFFEENCKVSVTTTAIPAERRVFAVNDEICMQNKRLGMNLCGCNAMPSEMILNSKSADSYNQRMHKAFTCKLHQLHQLQQIWFSQ